MVAFIEGNKSQLLVVYATQTGQSKAIAEDLTEMLFSKGVVQMLAEPMCISEFFKNHSLESESYIIFIVSTTGDGLGDTNYSNFCNFGKTLDKRLKEMNASSFCPSTWADDAVGLETVTVDWLKAVVDKVVELFGGSSSNSSSSSSSNVYGFSNNDISTDMVVEKCVATSLSLAEINNVKLCTQNMQNVKQIVKMDFDVSGCFRDVVDNDDTNNNISNDNINNTSISNNNDINGHDIYNIIQPGDTVGILCPNDVREVSELLELLGVNLPQQQHQQLQQHPTAKFVITDEVVASKKKITLPDGGVNVFDLFMWIVDVRAVLKKAFLLALAQMTTDPIEQRCLKILSSRQGSEMYNQLCLGSRLGIRDVLICFPSCKPSLGLIYENLPKLLPRPYSICSVSKNSSSHSIISILLSVAQFESIDFHQQQHQQQQSKHQQQQLVTRYGLCTGWLYNIAINFKYLQQQSPEQQQQQSPEQQQQHHHSQQLHHFFKVAMYLRRPTNFRPPPLDRPIIMVGPGTGVSPFIGFLEYRSRLIKEMTSKLSEKDKPSSSSSSSSFSSSSLSSGESWLFFGCRCQDDYIFKQELEQHYKDGVLTRLHVCFSRQSDLNAPRYVQDGIIQYRQELARVIVEKNALVYICGHGQKLSKSLHETFKDLLKSFEESTYKDYYEKMKADKRIIEDVWT
ncbi:hypothetical protein HELRODRAFT_192212 [Helobdella robusta]|uniref:Methionine synthase reductase n=1 Tax=Helobdella robusta TaxID=6412 RepID=T1FTP7_HELRO|nr:hypothetical protein HELRODRAFT_192212 [Helobdella robusta]ESO01626.1 hypothetical protein HELRODRAFT_192212 [Helobdella robusta]